MLSVFNFSFHAFSELCEDLKCMDSIFLMPQYIDVLIPFCLTLFLGVLVYLKLLNCHLLFQSSCIICVPICIACKIAAVNPHVLGNISYYASLCLCLSLALFPYNVFFTGKPEPRERRDRIAV